MSTTHEQTTTGSPTSYAAAPRERAPAGNAVDDASRVLGGGDGPLVLLQHFRGNLDNWDPALIDALAAARGGSPLTTEGAGPQMGPHRARLRRWRSTRSTSSMRWELERSICSDSRSAASWPRRSFSFALRSCARGCSPRRLPRGRLVSTVGRLR